MKPGWLRAAEATEICPHMPLVVSARRPSGGLSLDKWRRRWREGCIRVSQSEPKPDSAGEALHVGTAAAPVRISPENHPIPHLPAPGMQPDAGLAFGLGPLLPWGSGGKVVRILGS